MRFSKRCNAAGSDEQTRSFFTGGGEVVTVELTKLNLDRRTNLYRLVRIGDWINL